VANSASRRIRSTCAAISATCLRIVSPVSSEVVRLTGEGLKGSQRIVAEIRRLADMAVENRSLAEQVSVASSAMSQRGKALADNVAAFRLA
jgi:methyl-accepting chemotaxis protein